MERAWAIAHWLRETLEAQPWLAPVQPYLARTPDWAILAVPALIVLLLTWTLFGQRRNQNRAMHSRETTAPDSRRSQTTRDTLPTAPPAPAKPLPSESGQKPQPERPDVKKLPQHDDDTRAVRVFVSSTFLDMQRERDILVKEVFPAMQARMRTRGIELLAVDLRWGITREQSERGETLPTLLAEIDRCRPYFIGLIGDRYGWVPPATALTAELKATYPSIADAAERSVTEMEIVHGVLGNPDAARRAFFFERDPNWDWKASLSPADGAKISAETEANRAKLIELKAAIQAKVPHIETYRDPSEVGGKVLKALGDALDARFPETQAPDAFTQTMRLHAAYARERRGLHIGSGSYRARLDQWMATEGTPPILITGASGGGKSTLVANWLHAWRTARPSDIVFEHYLGASPDSADPLLVMRRLWEHLDRATGQVIDLPDHSDRLMDLADGLAPRIAQANAVAERNGGSILIALDGLDKLSSEQNLRWLLDVPRVKLLASSLDGEAKAAALSRGWTTLEINPLTHEERGDFIDQTLAGWGRKLLGEQIAAILAQPLSGSPLFLKTVLNELRVSATNAGLQQRLEHYLQSGDMPDLFARMLERLESDCGAPLVESALSLIWASRAGLEEAEMLSMTQAALLDWATLRNALGDTLRDQVGRLDFSHDFVRKAIETRYLSSRERKQAAHAVIADSYFSRVREPISTRQELLPRIWSDVLYQLRMANQWDRIVYCLQHDHIFNDLAPASYGFNFSPYMSGRDGGLPAWSEDPDALSPALIAKHSAQILPEQAWALASAFADHTMKRISEIAAFEKAVSQPTNKIHAFLETNDETRFVAYRDLVYTAARLSGFAPSLLIAKFQINVDRNAVRGPTDQRFISDGKAFFAQFDKTNRFVRYLADFARCDHWSGSLEDNFAGPSRNAWTILEAAVFGKSRPHPADFIRMSDLDIPVERSYRCQTDFGGIWEKDAGLDAFAVSDTTSDGNKVFYFVPMDESGAPPGHSPA